MEVIPMVGSESLAVIKGLGIPEICRGCGVAGGWAIELNVQVTAGELSAVEAAEQLGKKIVSGCTLGKRDGDAPECFGKTAVCNFGVNE